MGGVSGAGRSKSNVEIKARLASRSSAEEAIRRLGAHFIGEERQLDTYFRVPKGRLKLREIGHGAAHLIVYHRPDQPGPRRSDYELLDAAHPDRVKDLLDGVLGVETVVDKVRRIWLLGDTRIHLDSVRGLGEFLEFEAVHDAGDPVAESAARAEVERLIRAFEIRQGDLVPHSYRELSLERPF